MWEIFAVVFSLVMFTLSFLGYVKTPEKYANYISENKSMVKKWWNVKGVVALSIITAAIMGGWHLYAIVLIVTNLADLAVCGWVARRLK